MICFYSSIDGGHLDLLDFLVSCGIPCIKDNNGMSSLMQACQAGHHLIVDFFLERCSTLNLDINEKDRKGDNALCYAVRSERLDIVKNLLNRGSEVVTNKEGINVLAQCLNNGQHSIAQTILNGPADLQRAIMGRDEKGRTILHHLVASGDETNLRRLCQHFSPELDADNQGVTLLMTACQRSRISILKYLLGEVRVNIHAVDNRKRCALFYAIESSNLTAVNYILGLMKRLDEDIEGQTALFAAIMTGDLLIGEAILKSSFGRSMIHRCDKTGKNASHHAAILGRDAFIPLLVSFGCDMDLQDALGATPLMYACAGGHVSMASLLLRNEATIDSQDNEKQGALHYCFRDHPTLRCVKLLVNYGIDINTQDVFGTSPLMLACQKCAKSHISIVTYSLQRSADPFIQDKEGRDAFDHCPFDAEYVKGMMRRKGGEYDQNEDFPDLPDFASLLKSCPKHMRLTRVNSGSNNTNIFMLKIMLLGKEVTLSNAI